MHTEYIWPRRKAYSHQVFFPLLQSAWKLFLHLFEFLPAKPKILCCDCAKISICYFLFFISHIFIIMARLTTIWHWALCEVWLQKTICKHFVFESFSRSRFILFPSLHTWCHSGFEWPYFRSAVFCDGSVIRWEMPLEGSTYLPQRRHVSLHTNQCLDQAAILALRLGERLFLSNLSNPSGPGSIATICSFYRSTSARSTGQRMVSIARLDPRSFSKQVCLGRWSRLLGLGWECVCVDSRICFQSMFASNILVYVLSIYLWSMYSG